MHRNLSPPHTFIDSIFLRFLFFFFFTGWFSRSLACGKTHRRIPKAKQPRRRALKKKMPSQKQSRGPKNRRLPLKMKLKTRRKNRPMKSRSCLYRRRMFSGGRSKSYHMCHRSISSTATISQMYFVLFSLTKSVVRGLIINLVH